MSSFFSSTLFAATLNDSKYFGAVERDELMVLCDISLPSNTQFDFI